MIPLLLSLALLTDQKTWEREILCQHDSGYCTPRVVNLGAWDPRPADKDWPANASATESPPYETVLHPF